MSDETKEQLVTLHICGAKCDAGGTEEDGGHVFDRDFDTENSSGSACRCGIDNISWAMWSMP